MEAERAAARQAACAASTEAAEARRHASNEAHRLKTRLAAAAKKATESKEEAARLATQLQVLLHSWLLLAQCVSFACKTWTAATEVCLTMSPVPYRPCTT